MTLYKISRVGPESTIGFVVGPDSTRAFASNSAAASKGRASVRHSHWGLRWPVRQQGCF